MSSNYINANVVKIQDPMEMENIHLDIYLGLFFDGSSASKGIAQNLSYYYRIDNHDECERHYAISTIICPKSKYHIKYKNKNLEDLEVDKELAEYCADAVSSVLARINGILLGYWELRKDITIYIDVFGVDEGCIPAIAFCNIAEPGSVVNNQSYIYERTIADSGEGGVIGDFRLAGAKVVLNSYSFMDSSSPVEYESNDDLQILYDEVIENVAVDSQSYLEENSVGNDSTLTLCASITYNNGYFVINGNGNIPLSYEIEIEEDPQHPVLDGIQFALDMVSLALPPGFEAIPSLINAGISAGRGNWADACLSLVCVVPVVGDAAIAAKLAPNGMKVAKTIQKTEKVGNVVSASGKIAARGGGTAMEYTQKAANVVDLTKARAVKEWKRTGLSIKKRLQRIKRKDGTTGKEYIEEVPIDDYSIRRNNIDIKLDSSGKFEIKNVHEENINWKVEADMRLQEAVKIETNNSFKNNRLNNNSISAEKIEKNLSSKRIEDLKDKWDAIKNKPGNLWNKYDYDIQREIMELKRTGLWPY